VRLSQRWLDETRGLRWIMLGAMAFVPSVVYLGMVLMFAETDSGWWQGIRWATYGAFVGATVGITGWLRLLLSRLLRIGRQD